MFVIVNTGSSSLKLAVYEADGDRPVLSANVDRIGLPDSSTSITRGEESIDAPGARNHDDALRVVIECAELDASRIRAVGHRVVHGASRFIDPEIVGDDMLRELEALIPLDPAHLPQAIAAIRAVRSAMPNVPNIAVFDTAFHATIPAVNRTYAIPIDDRDAGIERYGFHGLSYESIVTQLREIDQDTDRKRTVIAHLGNGCSMCAVANGVSVDTTMGMTPAGGLVMGTRSGDLDPGVVLALLDRHPADDVRTILNAKSGLTALTGGTSDMREILERIDDDRDAWLAAEIFCHSARKHLAGMAASLGGIDRLVFTGGIGEHAAHIRSRICAPLAFLGIAIDDAANDRGDPIVSGPTSRAEIRMMRTDEACAILQHVRRIVRLQELSA